MEKRKMNDIYPYPKNAKEHSKKQVDQIANSIKEYGFNQPIVVDSSGYIIVGHGRYEAAKKLGIEEVPIVVVNLSEEQAKAYRLADNKLNESPWKMDLVIEELRSLSDYHLDLTGFDKDLLLTQEDRDDEVPELKGEPVAKLGDVFCLGPHKIICGDSTDSNVFERLLDGNKADMVFTDPPYLMNFDGAMTGDGGKTKTGKKHDVLLNDNLNKEEGDIFLAGFLKNIKRYCKGAYYISFYRLGIDRLLFQMRETRVAWKNCIVWKKEHINLSNSDYKSMYEPIIVGWDNDWTPIFYGWGDEHKWSGKKNEKDVWEVSLPSVWEINRTKKNDLHPTMKPVALIERAIVNSSKRNEVVLDLFLGSGTTLIACEKTGRICRAVELDPKYVDVAISRWVQYTGVSQVKRNGKTMQWS